jgi:hypothetical protein
MFGVSSTNMLLHRPISFFLHIQVACYHSCSSSSSSWGTVVGAEAKELQEGYSRHSKAERTHAEAPFTTAGAILIPQRADDLVVGIGDGEGRCQRGSRRHRQGRPHHSLVEGAIR